MLDTNSVKESVRFAALRYTDDLEREEDELGYIEHDLRLGLVEIYEDVCEINLFTEGSSCGSQMKNPI